MRSSSLYSSIGFRYVNTSNRYSMSGFLSRISMVGLIISVAILILVKAVMNGFDHELRTRILGVVPQASLEGDFGERGWSHYQQQILSNKFVTGVAPYVSVEALGRHGSKVAPIVIKGIHTDYESNVSRIDEYVSVPVSELKATQGQLPVIMGDKIAEKLNLNQGDSFIALAPQQSGAPKLLSLQLAGYIRSGTQLDQILVMTDIERLQSVLGEATPVSLQLSFDDLFMANAYTYHIQKRLPRGIYGRTWQSSHGNLYQAIQTSRSLINLLLVFIVAIAAFNVVSTLVLVVLDKRSDIAILRTQGATRWGVVRVFLTQGALIGVTGAIIGSLAGSVLSVSIAPLVSGIEAFFDIKLLDSSIYPISFVPVDWRLQDVISVSAMAIGAALIAAVYPAYSAGKADIVKGLRSL